jgi:hypothetical protein
MSELEEDAIMAALESDEYQDLADEFQIILERWVAPHSNGGPMEQSIHQERAGLGEITVRIGPEYVKWADPGHWQKTDNGYIWVEGIHVIRDAINEFEGGG